GHGEFAIAERVHDLDLVAGELAHAVGRMIGGAGRRAAVAEAAQVGGDHGEPFGELRRYPVPHQMRFWDAVQQQDRRPLPAPAAWDRRARRRDIEFLEPTEHDASFSLPGGQLPLASSLVPWCGWLVWLRRWLGR